MTKEDNIEENKNTHTTQKFTRWAQKSIHGRYYQAVHQANISMAHSFTWLTRGQLFPETEGFLMAIQDQVIATRNYRKHILKDSEIQTDQCRKCHMYPETIDHVVSGCKILAGTDYTDRHNTAAKIIHQEIALKHNLITQWQPYYKYHPEQILENEDAKLYWDVTLHTDRTVSHNRPDITYTLVKEKTTYLIDIAIPMDTNISQKEQEKSDKYFPLAMEIKDVWKQRRVKIIPLIMSPTGITPNTFVKHLEELKIHNYIHGQIQKAVVLKTCNIVRKFLDAQTT